ncbi:MAG: DUF1592 domain-containing protein [Myxococcaceae bacterium]
MNRRSTQTWVAPTLSVGTRRSRASLPLALMAAATFGCSGAATLEGVTDPSLTPGILTAAAGPALPAASSRVPRLTHTQWEETVRDLFGLAGAPGLASAFSPDPLGTSLFDNDEAVLSIGSGLWRDYQRAAEQISARVTATPADLARFVPAPLPTDPTQKANAFITDFGKRAFRRPLTSAEVTTYAALFAQGTNLTTVTDAFTAGVRVTVQAMLQSPHFVYRVESSSTAVENEIKLSGYEVASRLSYMMLGTMPPPTLFTAAEGGVLDNEEGVSAQAQLLLEDPRAKIRIASFHRQLFRVRQYENMQKSATVFPEFTAQTPAALQREHDLFVQSVVFDEKRGLKELLTAPYAFVNKVTAALYGLTAQGYSDEFQRVELDPAQRKGILTQVGFLAYFGTASQRNTILRGAFINLEVLCSDLPPPPAAVPPLPALDPGMTNRERIERHTGKGTCGAGCHGLLINPVGYGLEAFDGAGRVQTQDNGKPIDASATFHFDGQPKTYSSAAEMVDLIADSTQAHRCYSKHWLEFGLGRRHVETDDPLIAGQGDASRSGESLQALLLRLAASKTMRFRAVEVAP